MQCRTEYIAVQQQSMLQFWYDLIVCGKTSTTKYYIIHCRFLLNEEKHFKSLTWGPGGPIGPGRPTPSNPRSPRSPVSPADKLYTKVIKSTHWVESAKQRWRFLLHEFWHSTMIMFCWRSYRWNRWFEHLKYEMLTFLAPEAFVPVHTRQTRATHLAFNAWLPRTPNACLSGRT